MTFASSVFTVMLSRSVAQGAVSTFTLRGSDLRPDKRSAKRAADCNDELLTLIDAFGMHLTADEETNQLATLRTSGTHHYLHCVCRQKLSAG